jgi:hypothetical protein
MTTAVLSRTSGFLAASRAVVAYTADLLAGMERAVVGESNVRTAQRNAWDAICADRARAQARAEMDELVAALAATTPGRSRRQRPTGSAPRSTGSASVETASRSVGAVSRSVGSSPRSSASQAARLSAATR